MPKDPKRVAAGHRAWAIVSERRRKLDKLEVWMKLHGIVAYANYFGGRAGQYALRFDEDPDLHYRLTVEHNTIRRFARKDYDSLEALANTIIANWPYIK
jgi:hypothetical protein